MPDDLDNRIALPPTLIDFTAVGVTGQDHDEFPAPAQQPRYDWMRLYLIGLLANQSATERPTQFRTGTIFYNKSTNAFEYHDGDDWQDIASGIVLDGSDTDNIVTLASWFAEATSQLASIRPRVTWSGDVLDRDITTIEIPDSAKDVIDGICDDVHPMVYKNGALISPNSTRFATACPSSVELLDGETLDTGDRYTVIVERVDLLVPGSQDIP
jgi:hypothetical protein